MNEEVKKKKRKKTVQNDWTAKKGKHIHLVEIKSNIRETRSPSWTTMLYNYPTRGGEYSEEDSCFSITQTVG